MSRWASRRCVHECGRGTLKGKILSVRIRCIDRASRAGAFAGAFGCSCRLFPYREGDTGDQRNGDVRGGLVCARTAIPLVREVARAPPCRFGCSRVGLKFSCVLWNFCCRCIGFILIMLLEITWSPSKLHVLVKCLQEPMTRTP